MGSAAERLDRAVSYLEWDDSFSVDIISIDDDHKELFRLYNNLVDVAMASAPFEELVDAFQSVATHTQAHFQREERIMRNIGMSGFEAHVEQHDRLLKEAAQVANDLTPQSSREDISAVLAYLRLWVVRHITMSDSQIAAHLFR